jgi:hypothetical protein
MRKRVVVEWTPPFSNLISNQPQPRDDGCWLGCCDASSSNLYYVFFALAVVYRTVFTILPTILFRYSLKGGSLVYVPLVWIVHAQARVPVFERFNQICKWAFEGFRRIVALLTIAIIASKFAFPQFWSEVATRMYELGDQQFIDAFIAPTKIPKWQVSAALNGVLVWILFFVADVYVKADSAGRLPCVPQYVAAFVRTIWALSALLSFYAIGILMYSGLALQLGWSLVGEKWFP